MTEETGAGTTDEQGADAAATQAGADAESADRQETGAEVEAEKTIAVPEREFAAWKDKIESLNTLQEKLKRLEESAQHTPAAGANQAQIDWNQVYKHAQDGDAVAQAQIVTARALYIREQLDDIDDPAERRAVKKRVDETGATDVQRILLEIREGKRSEEVSKRDAEIENLRKQLAAATKKPEVNNVPGSSARSAPSAPKNANVMTQAQWQREQETLSDDERRARQRDRREGRIRVE